MDNILIYQEAAAKKFFHKTRAIIERHNAQCHIMRTKTGWKATMVLGAGENVEAIKGRWDIA